MIYLIHKTHTVGAANYRQITDLMSSKPLSECEGVGAENRLRDHSGGSGLCIMHLSSYLGCGFLWGDGRCDIKNA